MEEQVKQEISTETTPAQETTPTTTETTQPTQDTKPETTDTSESESWEYNGDRKEIPKPFEKYVKGLDRYVSKKDQAAAEFRKQAEEYAQFKSSDAYKQYQQFIEKQPNGTGQSEQAQPSISQEEIDAISLGDSKTLEAVIERKANQLLEMKMGPKEQELRKEVQALTMKQKQIENAEMIQSFAEVHPDFWELYEHGFEDYIVSAAKSGLPLDAIYNNITGVKQKLEAHLESKRKADFEKKKAGSVVGKSIPGTPDVVYADNEDHAKRLAIELTMKGDKRHVRIKPKK